MVDYESAARRLRRISDRADGFLSSTITREPGGGRAKPPTPGQLLLWADEWRENDVLYRIAIEGQGKDARDLFRRLFAVVTDAGMSFNSLALTAHEVTACSWRPLPSMSIAEALKLTPEERAAHSVGVSRVPSLSRCADLIAAVIRALATKSRSASREPTEDQEPSRRGGVGSRSPDSAEEEASAVAEGQCTKFAGGTMVFHPDRVELCGANICSGGRSESKRKALDLLRVKRDDGQFESYSGKNLAEKVGLQGGNAGGLIRDLRARISKCLLDQAGIDCGLMDVILRGKQGYRLFDKLSVQDGGDSEGGHLHGHEAGVAVGRDADRDPDRDPDHDPDHDADRGADDADSGADHDPATEADGSAAVRQKWILDELGKGRKLQTPGIAKELKRSRRTAQRDLDALKAAGKIEYVGPPRSGHYRLINDD